MMEIERKFTIRQLPDNLDAYPHYEIKQADLCTDPVMRIRKQDSKYIFTYKGRGLMVREEYNLPLTQEAFEKLLPKAEGVIIHKTRYKIPIEQSDLVIELDLFHAPVSYTHLDVYKRQVLQVICRRDKSNLRQIDRQFQIMILKMLILFTVKHFQHCGSSVSFIIPAHLINLIQQDQWTVSYTHLTEAFA